MILTKSKYHAIGFGLFACAAGIVAIAIGDHHDGGLFKLLVALGISLVLAGLFLLRYSWTIRTSR